MERGSCVGLTAAWHPIAQRSHYIRIFLWIQSDTLSCRPMYSSGYFLADQCGWDFYYQHGAMLPGGVGICMSATTRVAPPVPIIKL